ncbi:MAG TPA: histidine phosphatase family protein [Caulobacteraceae bacterium]|jgi:probable phosphoglycerate mutase
MTTTLFLVRHVPHELQGKVQVGRAEGIELGECNPERLAAVGRRLSGESLDAVHASPVERAQLTAHAVAEPHEVEVRTDPDLNELDFGDWTCVAFDELEGRDDYRAWNEHRSVHRAPNGETMLECQVRMVRAVETARRAHPEGRVALVSHGDPLKSLILYLLGMPLDAYGRFDLDPASVTTAVVGDWGAKVLRLNEATA